MHNFCYDYYQRGINKLVDVAIRNTLRFKKMQSTITVIPQALPPHTHKHSHPAHSRFLQLRFWRTPNGWCIKLLSLVNLPFLRRSFELSPLFLYQNVSISVKANFFSYQVFSKCFPIFTVRKDISLLRMHFKSI